MRNAILRWIDAVSGLLAGLLGLAGLTYAVFGPAYQQVQATTVSNSNGPPATITRTATASLASQGLHWVVFLLAMFLLLMLLAVLGVSAGAYLHSRRGGESSLLMLGASMGLLVVGVLLSAFSIGAFLLPAALLGLAALRAGRLTSGPVEAA
jgi:amino acid transporter